MENQNNDNLDKPVTLRHFRNFEQVSERRFKDFEQVSERRFKDFEQVSERRFKDFENRAFKTFVSKNDLKEAEERIIEKTRLDRDKTLTSNDKVAKEIATVRQEQKFGAVQDQRRDDKIEEHDKRLTHVETKLGIAPVAS